MAKRYGMNTPDVLRRRQNVADQQAAAYQARLMPNPGTPAWSQGLETSTPFFDIATVGMGGGMNLLRKGIGRKLAESRLSRQPAYTSPNVVGQQFQLPDYARQVLANAPPVVRRRGYPNRAANIAERRYERSIDEAVSGPTSKKAIRKIQVEQELERRAHQKLLQEQADEVSRKLGIARRRRAQGSMADDFYGIE